MLPTVVLVGRPNVGKSTLFNRLTRSRSAIVADIPGVTRDRHYGRARVGDRPFLVVDTGGFEPAANTGLVGDMARQTLQAVAEADAVVFMTDARDGLTAQDAVIARRLRSSGRPVWLVVNKAEGMNRPLVSAEFHELGLGDPLPISAAHGDGVAALIGAILATLPVVEPDEIKGPKQPRIAVVGRPNAGKSTLVNALLGEDRMIASATPGTTRDSIEVEFERRGKRYTLIDTAGMRRRARVSDVLEKFSVIKALQAIEDANVAILLIDASAGVTDQDAHIGSYIVEAGRAAVIAVNKWDAVDRDVRDRVKAELEHRLKFLDFARIHYVSALRLRGLDALLRSVDEAYHAAFLKLPTPGLTRAVREAVTQLPPPRRGLSRPKLRYAHQGGMNPPIVVVHGGGVDRLPDSYRRYLENRLRSRFELRGTPLRIEFRRTENPYEPGPKRRGD